MQIGHTPKTDNLCCASDATCFIQINHKNNVHSVSRCERGTVLKNIGLGAACTCPVSMHVTLQFVTQWAHMHHFLSVWFNSYLKRCYGKRRWAHLNVKLLHLLSPRKKEVGSSQCQVASFIESTCAYCACITFCRVCHLTGHTGYKYKFISQKVLTCVLLSKLIGKGLLLWQVGLIANVKFLFLFISCIKVQIKESKNVSSLFYF